MNTHVDWYKVEMIMRDAVVGRGPTAEQSKLLLSAFKLDPDRYRFLYMKAKRDTVYEIENAYRTSAKPDQQQLIEDLERRLANKIDEADYFRQLIAEYCEEKGVCDEAIGVVGMAGDDTYCDFEDCPYCRLIRKSLSYHGRTDGTQEENTDDI